MAPPRKTLPHVKCVRSKGKTYHYFDTGKIKPNGRPILARLPDPKDKGFGASYASHLGHRTRARTAMPVLTVAELVDRYQRSAEFGRLSPNTRTQYNVYLTVVHNQIGVAPAGEVHRRDVIALMDKMADRPGAANATVRIVGALWAWGRKRDLVTGDPSREVELHPARDYEPWPEPLVADALASDDPIVRRAVALLYFTAQRIGDVCRLRWSDIEAGVLRMRQDKTGKQLEIPIHPRLALILGPRPNSDGPLLARPDGMRYATSSIRERVQKFAAARGHKIVPHGLRKNAVNSLLEAGCSAAETAAVSGQSLQLVEHYAKRRQTGKLAARAIGKLVAAEA